MSSNGKRKTCNELSPNQNEKQNPDRPTRATTTINLPSALPRPIPAPRQATFRRVRSRYPPSNLLRTLSPTLLTLSLPHRPPLLPRGNRHSPPPPLLLRLLHTRPNVERCTTLTPMPISLASCRSRRETSSASSIRRTRSGGEESCTAGLASSPSPTSSVRLSSSGAPS